MYKNLDEMFMNLNSMNINYVVLRNYENFDSESFLVNHPDIDFLCENRELFISAIKSLPRESKKDRIHQKIVVNGKEVAIDIRTIGDGYLDSAWETSILDNKVMFHSFFVPDETNYYYSLLYHALIQKHDISKDYKERLNNMGIWDPISDRNSCLVTLEDYMCSNNYFYTIPEFSGATFNTNGINKNRINNDYYRLIKRILHRIIRGEL